MKVKIVNTSEHQLPSCETPASAGMDLRANLDEQAQWIEVEELLETEKGAGGFGSTGTK